MDPGPHKPQNESPTLNLNPNRTAGYELVLTGLCHVACHMPPVL